MYAATRGNLTCLAFIDSPVDYRSRGNTVSNLERYDSAVAMCNGSNPGHMLCLLEVRVQPWHTTYELSEILKKHPGCTGHVYTPLHSFQCQDTRQWAPSHACTGHEAHCKPAPLPRRQYLAVVMALSCCGAHHVATNTYSGSLNSCTAGHLQGICE